jgi:hypothetical protein
MTSHQFKNYFHSLFVGYLIIIINPFCQASACDKPLEIQSVQASVEQAGNPAVQAVDGDLSTRWSGYGKGAELIVDLGETKKVSCARIAWYRGNMRQNSFVISALDDDLTPLVDVYIGTSGGTTDNYETYSLEDTSARYLKIAVYGNTDNDWASISDLALMTTASDSVVDSGFKHPGVLVSKSQLDFVTSKVMNHEPPWRYVYERAVNSRYASSNYIATPRSIVNCSSHNAVDEGCSDEMDDAIAAYTQALLWYYTGDSSYAEGAVNIMNAWSATIVDHTGTNAPLQAGWAAEVWPRAAEIIRYTYSGWRSDDIAQFEKMLREVYLPEVRNGWWGGNNWDLTMIDATMAIAVFIDDRTLFDEAVAMWKGSVPAYIYLERDGDLPISPRIGTFSDGALLDLWKNPPRFVGGMTMETCRDQGHTAMGLAAIVNSAETALIQGVDLYAAEADRLTQAAEFNSQYLNGAEVPAWLCDGTQKMGGHASLVTYEILFNHYANRLQIPLENTRQWIQGKRSGVHHAMLHMNWEILTHGNTEPDADQETESDIVELPVEEPMDETKEANQLPAFLRWLFQR